MSSVYYIILQEFVAVGLRLQEIEDNVRNFIIIYIFYLINKLDSFHILCEIFDSLIFFWEGK